MMWQTCKHSWWNIVRQVSKILTLLHLRD